MGKSSKKSASKVDVAPAVAVPKLKSGKKGKREAEEVIEKLASAKKQKMEVKTQIKKKKEESSSSEEESSSDSEEEQQVKVTIKKGAIPAKPTIAESSGDETSSDDEPAVKVAVPSKKLPQAVSRNGTAGTPAKKGKQASSSDSSSDSAEDEPAIPLSAGKPSIKATETENSSEESSDESSDDEPSKKQPVKKIPAQVPVESSSEDEEEESEEQPSKTPKKTDTDVEMIDATSPKTNTKQLKTPATPQSTGSKTVFVGNLPFDVEQDDVINFFKDAGEVIDMRVGFFDDGRPKGFCHVEFATAEEAQKALKLNDGSLMGRRLRLNMANERGSHTPNTGKESNSFQKDGKGQSQTVFVRGFDNSVGEEEIRSSLLAHFSSCGEISGQAIRIPVDRETQSVKGIAYLQFNDADSFSKALELNGSELGEGYLTVEEAKPRGDNRDGGDSGRGGWRGSGGRFGGRDGRGRGGRDGRGRGGRDGRGRGGRDGRGRGGRDGGRFGSRGRGRGPSMFAAGAGKKTTFND